MAITNYEKQALTGGTASALDSIDGALLLDNDMAFVTVGEVLYVYRLDDNLGGAESSPAIISPDTNAGNKRWVLQPTNVHTKAADSTLSGTPVVLTAIGSDGVTYRWKAYPTST